MHRYLKALGATCLQRTDILGFFCGRVAKAQLKTLLPANKTFRSSGKASDRFLTVRILRTRIPLALGHIGAGPEAPPVLSEATVCDFTIQRHLARRAGCLPASTRVLTDAGHIRIGDIVKQRMKLKVLSFNTRTGFLEWKPIVGWYDNGSTGTWLQIRSCGNRSFTATPSHMVYAVDSLGRMKKIPAEQLTLQHKLLTRDNDLSDDQHQYMLGSLLGDASVVDVWKNKRECGCPVFSFGQSEVRKEYAAFAADFFGCRLERRPPSQRRMAFFHFRFRHAYNFRLRDLCYPDGKKAISDEWLKMIGPRALAVWFMDDGQWAPSKSYFGNNKLGGRPRNLGRDKFAGQVYLYTMGFSKPENEEIAAFLYKKYGLRFSVRSRKIRTAKYFYLCSNDIQTNKTFFNLIATYMHSCMQYKSPVSVGTYTWSRGRGERVYPVPIIKIEKKRTFTTGRSKTGRGWATAEKKYDIGIDGNHNYFTGGVLVSNSHYDLRLILGGKAYSWASRKPMAKALFLQPPHSPAYASWEGEIKEGYGAGQVTVWDKGKAVVRTSPSGTLHVQFFGEKTKGSYALVAQKGYFLCVREKKQVLAAQPANVYTTKIPDEVWDDPNVIAEHKIDGCFAADMPVMMGDGSWKRIDSIRVGEKVMCLTHRSGITGQSVVRIFNNGSTDEWIRFTFGAVGKAGRHSITCTPDHRICVIRRRTGKPDRLFYKKAKNLKRGDLLCSIYPQALNLSAYDIVLGSILGDASIKHTGTSGNLGICENKKTDHAPYLRWKYSFVRHGECDQVSGLGTRMRLLSTAVSPIFNRFRPFLGPGRKIVPGPIELTPLSLAIWYQDDGSRDKHADVRLATESFSKREIRYLQVSLRSIGIETTVLKREAVSTQFRSRRKFYYGIRIRRLSHHRFFTMIAPYIHPCMAYKLPPGYVAGKLLGGPTIVNEPTRCETRVLWDAKPVTKKQDKWDLEVKGYHNYVVRNILVHNSNFTACADSKGLTFVSRRLSVNGRPIDRSDNIPHLRDLRLPKIYHGSLVQGEIAYVKNVRGIPVCSFETQAGILNSLPPKAVESQRRLGKLEFHVFEVIRAPGLPRTAAYGERREWLKGFVKACGSSYVRLPEGATRDKHDFYRRVVETKAKILGTQRVAEGVVLKNLKGDRRSENFRWFKAKTSDTWDLVITGFQPGQGRLKGKGIGALLVSDRTGRLVGKVGSGLTDEERIDAFQHPRRYLGRVVEIKAMAVTDAGSLRAPRLHRWRPDKSASMADVLVPQNVGQSNRSIPEAAKLGETIRAQEPGISPKDLKSRIYALKMAAGWRPK